MIFQWPWIMQQRRLAYLEEEEIQVSTEDYGRIKSGLLAHQA